MRTGHEQQQAKRPAEPARQRHTAESVPGEFAGAAVTRGPGDSSARVRVRGALARRLRGSSDRRPSAWRAVRASRANTVLGFVSQKHVGGKGKSCSMLTMETWLETRLGMQA